MKEESFNKELAEKHLKKLLRTYKIKVVKWSSSSCGKAYWSKQEVKIPRPTNIDRFCVCMHEIKHIIDGKTGLRFEMEFNCDKYALEQAQELKFDTCGWIKRMKWHSLSRIAMAHNRGLKTEKINDEIREFFSTIDFSSWNNKKIFVQHSKTDSEGYIIKTY